MLPRVVSYTKVAIKRGKKYVVYVKYLLQYLNALEVLNGWMIFACYLRFPVILENKFVTNLFLGEFFGSLHINTPPVLGNFGLAYLHQVFFNVLLLFYYCYFINMIGM